MYRTISTAFLVSALAGCAGLGFQPSMKDLSAQAQETMAKSKEVGALCYTIEGAGIKTTGLILNQEKIVGTAGGEFSLKCGAGELISSDRGKAATDPKPSPPKP